MTSTAERFPAHTPQDINRRIQNQIGRRVRYYAGRPEEITVRLRELDGEWASNARLRRMWLRSRSPFPTRGERAPQNSHSGP
jgi:hypothetical protein